MKVLLFTLLLLAVLAPSQVAVQRVLCPALLPVNASASASEGLSEDQLNQLLALFQKIYPDIDFQSSWFNNTINAQALRFDESKLIIVYGGLVREPTTTPDSLALMICHEVGHHQGGKPYFPDGDGKDTWASAEGAADYYSIRGCFTRIASMMKTPTARLSERDEALLEQTCANSTKPTVCRRALQSGALMARLQWNVFSNNQPVPALDAEETNLPPATLLGYPSPQCRLDTFRASALLQERPACWYRPL